jgi:hypothetical protein
MSTELRPLSSFELEAASDTLRIEVPPWSITLVEWPADG